MNKGFLYFPKPLYNKTVKIINKTVKFIGFKMPSEIFYSTKDGLWSDVTVWETVSGRVGRIPSANDDVYIHNRVTLNTITTISNFFVSANGSAIYDTSAKNLTITGDIKAIGAINMSPGGQNHGLFLGGRNNYINPLLFTPGSSTVNYIRNGNQDILDLSYYRLSMTVGGIKSAVSSLTILGNLIVTNCQYNLAQFDLTVNGATSINAGTEKSIMCGLYKPTFGNLLFIGTLDLYSGGAATPPLMLVGNPDVELRSNLIISGNNNDDYISYPCQTGTGIFKFTTSPTPQIVTNVGSTNSYITIDANIQIDSGIILTLANNTTINLTNVCNGLSAGSQFINQGRINFYTLTAASGFMTTGTQDFTTTSNTIAYLGNYTITLPYAGFRNLYIGGTGTKTQSSSASTINGTLTIAILSTFTAAINTTVVGAVSLAGTMNLLTYDWTFSSTFTLNYGNLYKTGAGALIFGGLWSSGASDNSTISLTGNPTVEVRNGINFSYNNTFNVNFNSGTGAWSATTNNQTWQRSISVAQVLIYSCPITIASGITLTVANGVQQFNGVIDGASGTSKLLVASAAVIWLGSNTAPMATGTFDTTTNSLHTIGYVYVGNYTIPLTSFYSLYIGGASGTKTLSGTTTVGGTLQIGNGTAAGDTLELSTFNLTVTGVTTLFGILSKTGAGSVLFIGNLTYANYTAGSISFATGNPTVELRGGLTLRYNNTNLATGSGQWSFSTNNQTIDGQSVAQFAKTFDCPILISGAITVTIQNGAECLFNGAIDGNNAASTLDNRLSTGSLGTQYQSATRPMVTGVLQCNGAANTWKYNRAGNQDITGGTYRTLTLAGSGVKTLQGNVVVATTYTLTSPATLNLNGFTRT